MTTKLPSIPSFDGENVGEVLTALTEATQVRVGVRGDALDAGVTFRDLAEIGLLQETSSNASVIQGLSASVNLKLPDGEISPVYDGASDLTTPPAPTDLKAVAVFDTVMLSWNVARFANPSYYEVFRSYTNDLSSAQIAGTSSSQFFTDIVGEERTLYYWVRTVSQAGVRSAWNSAFGTEVTTGVDPAKIIPILQNQVLESSLFKSLSSRIDDAYDQTRASVRAATLETRARVAAIQQERDLRIAAVNAEAATRAAEILAEAALRQAAITNEQIIRQTADESLASNITLLTASTQAGDASLQAAIQSEATARTTADEAEATQRDTLAVQMRGAYTGTDVDQLTTGLLYSERTARVSSDSAIAQDVSLLKVNYADNTAAIQNEQYVRSTADESLASNITTLNTQFATNTAAISSEQIARSTADESLASNITNLNTQFENNSAAITNEQYVRSTADQSLALDISNLTAQYNGVAASVTSEQIARVNADGSLAADITTLRSDLNNAIAVEASARSSADGNLYAQYTVKIDQNGYVSGFGLASETVNGTPSSQFVVRADRFSIVNPAVGGLAITAASAPTSSSMLWGVIGHGMSAGDRVFFTDVTGINRLAHYTVTSTVGSNFFYTDRPAGEVPAVTAASKVYVVRVPFIVDGGKTYIDTAVIKDADITDAKIGSVAAKKITAGYINASIAINGAKVFGSELYSGGTTSVTTDANGNITAFTANNPTVKIAGGNAEFVVNNFKVMHLVNNAFQTTTPFEVDGDVVRIKTALIGDGTIGSAKIAETIESTNYATSATGWQLTKAGAFNLKNGTITAGLIKSVDEKMKIDLTNGFIRIEA
jgi:hypothetical protein